MKKKLPTQSLSLSPSKDPEYKEERVSWPETPPFGKNPVGMVSLSTLGSGRNTVYLRTIEGGEESCQTLPFYTHNIYFHQG